MSQRHIEVVLQTGTSVHSLLKCQKPKTNKQKIIFLTIPLEGAQTPPVVHIPQFENH